MLKHKARIPACHNKSIYQKELNLLSLSNTFYHQIRTIVSTLRADTNNKPAPVQQLGSGSVSLFAGVMLQCHCFILFQRQNDVKLGSKR